MPKGGEIGRKAHFFRLMCYVDRARADVAYAFVSQQWRYTVNETSNVLFLAV